MAYDKLEAAWRAFQDDHPGTSEISVISKEGEILYSSGDAAFTAEEAVLIRKAWTGEESAIHVDGKRFVILKREEIQLVGINKSDNLTLLGSVGQSGNYTAAILGPNAGGSAIQLSVDFNRAVWEYS